MRSAHTPVDHFQPLPFIGDAFVKIVVAMSAQLHIRIHCRVVLYPQIVRLHLFVSLTHWILILLYIISFLIYNFIFIIKNRRLLNLLLLLSTLIQKIILTTAKFSISKNISEDLSCLQIYCQFFVWILLTIDSEI